MSELPADTATHVTATLRVRLCTSAKATAASRMGGQGQRFLRGRYPCWLNARSPSRGHPPQPPPNTEVTALIRKITGEPVTHTTIWKLRNGQATNPQKRLIEAMARTSGARPSFSAITMIVRPA